MSERFRGIHALGLCALSEAARLARSVLQENHKLGRKSNWEKQERLTP